MEQQTAEISSLFLLIEVLGNKVFVKKKSFVWIYMTVKGLFSVVFITQLKVLFKNSSKYIIFIKNTY